MIDRIFILFIAILLLIGSNKAEARTVKRGEFTSSGYVQHHERNDHKGYGKGYSGYQPYKYDYRRGY